MECCLDLKLLVGSVRLEFSVDAAATSLSLEQHALPDRRRARWLGSTQSAGFQPAADLEVALLAHCCYLPLLRPLRLPAEEFRLRALDLPVVDLLVFDLFVVDFFLLDLLVVDFFVLDLPLLDRVLPRLLPRFVWR